MKTRVFNSRSGFTLLEVMFSTALVGILAASVIQIARTGGAFQRTVAVTLDVEAKSSRTLNQIIDQLKTAGLSTLTPALNNPADWSSELVFRQAIGATGTGTAFGDPVRIRWQSELGDATDDADNDGDGFVDEGRVVFTRDVGGLDEQSVTWCTGVTEFLEGEDGTTVGVDDNGNGLEEEAGLCFSRDGNLLIVRLTMERFTPDGIRMTRTIESGVRLVN